MLFEYYELKECVEEDFKRFYVEMGFNPKQVYPAVMNEYEHGEDYCLGENVCVHIFLLMNYKQNNLDSYEIENDLKKLLDNEEQIKNDLGKQYFQLMGDINKELTK